MKDCRSGTGTGVLVWAVVSEVQRSNADERAVMLLELERSSRVLRKGGVV